MTDRLSPEKRSWNMGRVRSKDTGPEVLVRSLLHRMGFRFRLHNKNLPGTPDIVLSRHKTVIFVHGCYWHRHPGCKYASTPKTNTDFWKKKFSRNVERDKEAYRDLIEAGWKVLVIWQCETKEIEALEKRIKKEFRLDKKKIGSPMVAEKPGSYDGTERK